MHLIKFHVSGEPKNGEMNVFIRNTQIAKPLLLFSIIEKREIRGISFLKDNDWEELKSVFSEDFLVMLQDSLFKQFLSRSHKIDHNFEYGFDPVKAGIKLAAVA